MYFQNDRALLATRSTSEMSNPRCSAPSWAISVRKEETPLSMKKGTFSHTRDHNRKPKPVIRFAPPTLFKSSSTDVPARPTRRSGQKSSNSNRNGTVTAIGLASRARANTPSAPHQAQRFRLRAYSP